MDRLLHYYYSSSRISIINCATLIRNTYGTRPTWLAVQWLRTFFVVTACTSLILVPTTYMLRAVCGSYMYKQVYLVFFDSAVLFALLPYTPRLWLLQCVIIESRAAQEVEGGMEAVNDFVKTAPTFIAKVQVSFQFWAGSKHTLPAPYPCMYPQETPAASCRLFGLLRYFPLKRSALRRRPNPTANAG